MIPLKIVVLGERRVGKSAVTVRFLTKRYIGEYNSKQDHLYRHVRSDPSLGSSRTIEILDISGSWDERPVAERQKVIHWSSGVVLVYDICDRHSFNFVFKLLRSLPEIIPTSRTLLILGNKADLTDVGRDVDTTEGKNLASRFNAYFFEVSAIESSYGITSAFDCLIRHLVNLHPTSLVFTPPSNGSSSTSSSASSPVTIPVGKRSMSISPMSLSPVSPNSSFSCPADKGSFFPSTFLSLKKSPNSGLSKRSSSVDSASSTSTIMYSANVFCPDDYDYDLRSVSPTTKKTQPVHKRSWTSQFNRLTGSVLSSGRKSSLSLKNM